MKRRICILLAVAMAAIASAQSNPVAPATTNTTAAAPSHRYGITSDRLHFDGTTRQLVYYDHVVFTNDQKMTLMCERVTADIPEEGEDTSHPKRLVAETNLDIICLDQHGKTNHLTADKGVYTYAVNHGVTNEIITFTGHCLDTVNDMRVTGEPMIWNNITKDLDIINPSVVGKMQGTNSSPFNIK